MLTMRVPTMRAGPAIGAVAAYQHAPTLHQAGASRLAIPRGTTTRRLTTASDQVADLAIVVPIPKQRLLGGGTRHLSQVDRRTIPMFDSVAQL